MSTDAYITIHLHNSLFGWDKFLLFGECHAPYIYRKFGWDKFLLFRECHAPYIYRQFGWDKFLLFRECHAPYIYRQFRWDKFLLFGECHAPYIYRQFAAPNEQQFVMNDHWWWLKVVPYTSGKIWSARLIFLFFWQCVWIYPL